MCKHLTNFDWNHRVVLQVEVSISLSLPCVMGPVLCNNTGIVIIHCVRSK